MTSKLSPWVLLLFLFIYGSCDGQVMVRGLGTPIKVTEFTNSTDVFQPSGLAFYDGFFYTISDKDDNAVYRFKLNDGVDKVKAERVPINITLPQGIKHFDFEGIYIDRESGSVVLLSEKTNMIYFAASLHGEFAPFNTDLQLFYNIFTRGGFFSDNTADSSNARLEGITILPENRLLLLAEREPRGFLIFHYDNGEYTFCKDENYDLSDLDGTGISSINRPVPDNGKNLDFADVFYDKDTLYLLSRLLDGIYVVPLTDSNLLQSDFNKLEKVQFWSFDSAMTSFQYCGGFKDGKCDVGTAEGLYMDNGNIYVALDNNAHFRNGDKRLGNSTVILKFTRWQSSNMDITSRTATTEKKSPFIIFNEAKDNKAIGPIPCSCCQDVKPDTPNDIVTGPEVPQPKVDKVDNTVKHWALSFDKSGLLKGRMPEYVKEDDVFDFDISAIKVDDVNVIRHQIDSTFKALAKLCKNGNEPVAQCCFTEYQAMLKEYTGGSRITCGDKCDDWMSFVPPITFDTIWKAGNRIETQNEKIKAATKLFPLNEFKARLINAKEAVKTDVISDINCTRIDTISSSYYAAHWLYFKVYYGEYHIKYTMSYSKNGAAAVYDIDTIVQTITRIDDLEPSVKITISQGLDTSVTLKGSQLKNFSIEKYLPNKHSNFNDKTKTGYRVDFVVAAPDVRNQIISAYMKYLKEKKVAYYSYDKIISQETLGKLKDKMEKIYNELVDYNIHNNRPACKNCFGFTATDSKAITSDLTTLFSDNGNNLITVDKVICKDRPWIKATTWINGTAMMNPLLVFDTTAMGIALRDSLTRLADELALLNSTTSRFQTGIHDHKDEINLLFSKHSAVEDTVLALQAAIRKIQNQMKADTSFDKYTVTNKIYHSGQTLVSTDKSIDIIKEHNGKYNFLLDKSALPIANDRYDKGENIWYQLYNIPAATKVTIINTLRDAPVDDGKSNFAIAVNEAAGDAGQNNTEFVDFVKEKNGGREKPVPTLSSQINCFLQYYGKVLWLNQQTVPVYTTTYPQKTEGPIYRDTLGQPRQVDKKTDLYYIMANTAKDTLKTDSVSFTIYHKQYIQLTFGVGYVPGGNYKNFGSGRYTSVYNASTGSFTNTYLSPVDVIYGLKIFPFGINVRRWWPSSGNPCVNGNRYRNLLFRRGDYIANRIYFLLGASLSQKQLFNFYTGAGLEIIPGLGFNMGCNLYSTNQYNIQNGVVEGSYQTPTPTLYFAITVDPIVFLQITNVFGAKF